MYGDQSGEFVRGSWGRLKGLKEFGLCMEYMHPIV